MVTPTPTTVQVKFQLRIDTAANWASVNPVLLSGEMGLESNTNKFKIGNGSTAWNSLGYFPFVVSGGTVTGNLEIGTTGTLTFEGSSADNFETTLGVINPTADRTINLPNVSGTIITTGDTGTVTSTMIADGTIVNADINASAAIAHSKLATITAGYVLIGNASGVPTATQVTGDVTISDTGVTAISSGVIVDADVSATAEIAVSKLANGTANQVIVTDGTNVSWSDDLTLAGNLTVNGTTTTINTQDLLVEDKNIIIGNVATPTDVTADGGGITLKGATDKTINWVDSTDAWTSSERFSVPLGSAASPSLTFTGDENTGIYSPGADQVAISTNGTGRLFVNSSGNVGVGTSPANRLHVSSSGDVLRLDSSTTDAGILFLDSAGGSRIGTRSGSIIFDTGASERLRITSDGKAGIGTSSPGSILHCNYATATDTYIRTTNSVGTSGFDFGVSSGGEAWVFNRNNSNMYLGTNSAQRMTITAGGNVGIGTTSPQATLDVQGAVSVRDGNSYQWRSASGGTDQKIWDTYADNTSGNTLAFRALNDAYSAGYAWLAVTRSGNQPQNIIFYTGAGSERARIDNSGRLLVGTSSVLNVPNRASTAVGPSLEIAGTTAGSTTVGIAAFFTDTSFAPCFTLAKSNNASVGSHTAVADGTALGEINFAGSNGSSFLAAATISAFADGAVSGGGANDMPGRLVFSTTADGASSPQERMRITQAGYVGINGTPTRRLEVLETRAGEFTAALNNASTTGHALALLCNSSDTTGIYLNGYSTSASATRINIYSNGNIQNANNSYGAISDAKLKENIADASSQWVDIKAIQVRNYNLKTEPGHRQIGVIAQEIEQVSPGLVYESPDQDAEGNDLGTVTKSVNYSVLYMKAVKALQEAMERIETLEAKVAALETP